MSLSLSLCLTVFPSFTTKSIDNFTRELGERLSSPSMKQVPQRIYTPLALSHQVALRNNLVPVHIARQHSSTGILTQIKLSEP